MNDKLQKALEQLIQYNVCMCEGGDSYDPLMADYHVQRAREILTEALAASKPEPQAQAEPEVPPHLDVRRIMLRIVPGFDGEGEEVYATTVDEVVELLSEMGLWSEAIAKKDAALKPLTDEQIAAAFEEHDKKYALVSSRWSFDAGIEFAKQHYGIKEQA